MSTGISQTQLTFDNFFELKFETGIKSKCVGRFNDGSGVTGIGSAKKTTIFKRISLINELIISVFNKENMK